MANTKAKTVEWTINRQTITVEPSQNSSPQYYTGNKITANFDNFDSNKMTITGNVATTVGTHTATITPKSNYMWSDGSTAGKPFDWVISAPPYRTMTAVIDLSNSNPDTCVSYSDDAVGMTAKSSNWDEFFGEYPCLFYNGAEVKKLNPNNFAQDINGNSTDITSGNNGDVMIAFPKRALKISTSGLMVTISMTDNPNPDSSYKYYAHQRGSTTKDKFYIGAYKGYELNSKLRSLSGKTPTVNKTISAFRTLARANGGSNGSGGSGYDQFGFYQLTYLQAMYILKYKSLNAQTALGRGFVDGNSASTSTGGANTKGMDFGETTGKQQMKLFGIEDFYGNIFDWIDGLYCDSSRNILTATQGFNDTGSGYTNQGQGATSNIGNWLSKPQGTSERGFIAKEVSGSSTTYFCDYSYLYASCLPIFGGNWSGGDTAGVFRLNVNNSASNSGGGIGARLMYL